MNKKKGNHSSTAARSKGGSSVLRRVRIALALLFFIGITLLFLDFTGTLHHYLGWMAKLQFLPAVLALNFIVVALLLVLTLIFGRIYCSVVCPLGVMQDGIAWIHGRFKKNRYSTSPERPWLRLSVLVVFVVAMVVGASSLAALLAPPYSSYGRMVMSIARPVYELGNNVLASVAEHYDSYAFYSVDVWMRSLPTLIVAVVSFAVVATMAWIGGRSYCNTICPVGTLLSFVSRFSLFKVRIDADRCRNCSLCAKNCKASCIDLKSHTVDYSRCVACGNCLTKCHFDAIHYTLPRPAKAVPTNDHTPAATSVDVSRRSFVVSSLLAGTTLALAQEKKKVDGGLAFIEEKIAPARTTPLTPPGSLSARNLQTRCTACQLCVSKCPNGVLRPGTSLLTMMQPTMSYERGYCRPECTACSDVCPTGAIRPIDKAEKSSIQIGHAVWIRDNCVCVTDDADCGNCERHCPTGAIQMVPLDPSDEYSVLVPAVNEARCIGCGACENLCPARPFSAIYVEGHEVHRTV